MEILDLSPSYAAKCPLLAVADDSSQRTNLDSKTEAKSRIKSLNVLKFVNNCQSILFRDIQIDIYIKLISF